MTDEITWRYAWDPALYQRCEAKLRQVVDVPVWIMFAALFALMFAGMMLADLIAPPGGPIGVIVGFFAGWIYLIAWTVMVRRRGTELRRAAPIYQGEWTVSATPRGTDWQKPGTRTTLDWSTVTAVAEVPGAILIHTSGFEALPLPDEGLPGGVSHSDAIRQLRTWHAAARG